MKLPDDPHVQEAIRSVESEHVRKSTPMHSSIDIPFSKLATENPRPDRPSLLPHIRYMMLSLGLDETRLLDLRLEHKLLQSLVLRRYKENAFPETIGLAQAWQSKGALDFGDYLNQRFPSGFCIKRALGACSPRGMVDANNSLMLTKLSQGGLVIPKATSVLDESWIVQARVWVQVEYKIHTLEDTVIPHLSFRYTNTDLDSNKQAAECFVSNVLSHLPAGLVKDSFCCWDIARTSDNHFEVIEVNYAGIHLVCRPGYQCSGLLQNGPKAPANFSLLVTHIQKEYAVKINYSLSSGDNTEPQEVYFKWVDWWTRLLRIRELTISLAGETRLSQPIHHLEDLIPYSRNLTERMHYMNLASIDKEVSTFMFPSDW